MHVGECVTKETRAIKQVLLEIWPAQVSCTNFVSIWVLTGFLKSAVMAVCSMNTRSVQYELRTCKFPHLHPTYDELWYGRGHSLAWLCIQVDMPGCIFGSHRACCSHCPEYLPCEWLLKAVAALNCLTRCLVIIVGWVHGCPGVSLVEPIAPMALTPEYPPCEWLLEAVVALRCLKLLGYEILVFKGPVRSDFLAKNGLTVNRNWSIKFPGPQKPDWTT